MSECKLPRREEEEGVGGREEQRQPIRTFSPPERSKIACRRLPHVSHHLDASLERVASTSRNSARPPSKRRERRSWKSRFMDSKKTSEPSLSRSRSGSCASRNASGSTSKRRRRRARTRSSARRITRPWTAQPPGSTPGILPRRSSWRARSATLMGVALGMPAALDSEAMDIGLPGLGSRLPTRRCRSARTVVFLPFRQPVPGGYDGRLTRLAARPLPRFPAACRT